MKERFENMETKQNFKITLESADNTEIKLWSGKCTGEELNKKFLGKPEKEINIRFLPIHHPLLEDSHASYAHEKPMHPPYSENTLSYMSPSPDHS